MIPLIRRSIHAATPPHVSPLPDPPAALGTPLHAPSVQPHCGALWGRASFSLELLSCHSCATCPLAPESPPPPRRLHHRAQEEHGNGLRHGFQSTSPCRRLTQEERGDELHHALGVVEGHEGDQSLRVRFKLTDAAQAGNARGLQR